MFREKLLTLEKKQVCLLSREAPRPSGVPLSSSTFTWNTKLLSIAFTCAGHWTGNLQIYRCLHGGKNPSLDLICLRPKFYTKKLFTLPLLRPHIAHELRSKILVILAFSWNRKSCLRQGSKCLWCWKNCLMMLLWHEHGRKGVHCSPPWYWGSWSLIYLETFLKWRRINAEDE